MVKSGLAAHWPPSVLYKSEMRKLKSSSFKVSDSESEYQIESINYVPGSLTKVSTHQVFELSDWKEALFG